MRHALTMPDRGRARYRTDGLDRANSAITVTRVRLRNEDLNRVKNPVERRWNEAKSRPTTSANACDTAPSVSARTCPSGLLSRPQRRTEPRTERGFLSWAADCAPARAARPEGIVEPDMSCAWRVPSVAVDDFDIQRSAVGEPEADAPLVIDADAPLAVAIACQSLEPIVRWNLRLLHPHNPIEDGEFSQCDCLDVPKPRNALTVEQGICFAATKRPDGHSPSTIGTR